MLKITIKEKNIGEWQAEVRKGRHIIYITGKYDQPNKAHIEANNFINKVD